jgi:Transposase DDE domain group 1
VGSAPTVWRTLAALSTARLRRVEAARPGCAASVWSLLPHGVPPSRVTDADLGDVVVLDVYATIVVAHGEKESAAPTFKNSFGFHPIAVWCDNTTELLAARLRRATPGPTPPPITSTCWPRRSPRSPNRARKNLLIRADGADASHGLLDWLTEQNQLRGRRVDYSIGFALTEALRQAITVVLATVWTPALDADGGVRAGGDVAELTGLLDLSRWPPECGSSCAANGPTPAPNSACSRNTTDTGIRRSSPTPPPGSSPSWRPDTARTPASKTASATPKTVAGAASRRAINTAWLSVVTIAADLVAWLPLLALTGPLATAEPKAFATDCCTSRPD